jgi:hypothetical protein
MALDPRIALMGTQWQAPDIQGALAKGQEYRTNQMAMQAAEDTAARAAAAREAARTVNFMDPTAASGFLSAYGADVAEPYLAAGARAAGTSVAQAGSARAQTTQDREGLDRIRGAWGRGLVFALADSSDTGLTALRGRLVADGVPEAEVDETLARIGSMDAALRPDFIRNLASTDKDAREALEFVAPKPERINRGGTIVTVDMNPNSATYNQEIRTDTVTESPNRPHYITGDDGTVYRVSSSGPAAPVPVEGGGNLTGRVPGTAPTAAQQADELKREVALSTIQSGATSLLSDFRILRNQGYMRTEALNPLQNFGLGVRQIFPMIEGMARSVNPAADAAAARIQGTISSMISQLRNVTGGTAREIDAVKELELALAQLGNSSGNYEASVDLVRALQARMAVVQRIYDEGGFRGDGGGGPAAGGGRATHRNAQGQGIYWNGSAWVPGT